MTEVARNLPPALRLITSTRETPSTRAALVGVPTTPVAEITQLPAKVDLASYQGDDFAFTLTALNADQSPTDFTGATMLAQIKSRKGDATPAAMFTTSVSGNVVTLTLNHATAQMLSGVFEWDCQITYAS
jgi:hypothetical protein